MHRRSEKEQGNFNTLKKRCQDFFAVPGRCAAAARDRHTYAAFAHNVSFRIGFCTCIKRQDVV